MKNLVLVMSGVLFLASTSFAQSKADARLQAYASLSSCNKTLSISEDYLVAGVPAASVNSQLKVFSLNGADAQTISVYGTVVDAKVQGDIVYILTQSTFGAWSLKDKKSLFLYPSHPEASHQTSARAHATGFVLKGNTAVITHGLLGFSVLDFGAGNFVKLLPMPSVSVAEDIDLIDANTAIVAVDDDAEGQFHGLYVFDTNRLEISKQIPVENFAMQSVRIVDPQTLVLVYFNAVWKFDLQSVLNAKKITQPLKNIWQFPGMANVSIIGHVAIDQKNLYACMDVADQAGFLKATPKSFSLQSLGY